MPQARSTRASTAALGVLIWAAAISCATAEPPRRPSAAGGAPEADCKRPAVGVLMLGPSGIDDTPYQRLWGVTIRLLTSPIWFPYWGVIHGREGRQAADEAVYGPGCASEVLVAAVGQELPARDLDLGSYHALVIGNADYAEFTPLETPLQDAHDVASVLADEYGFEVEILENAGRARILAAITRLRSELEARDNLLVYYAGHGHIDRETGEGYWLPVDASRDDLANWLATGTVSTQIKGMRAKHVLVISDSCYAGSLTRSAPARPGGSRQTTAALVRISRKRARLVLTSGGVEPVADAGDGRNSVFAQHLLGALRENRGVLEGSELFWQLRGSVMQSARQTPEYAPVPYAGHDGGDFLFVRQRARSEAEPAPAPEAARPPSDPADRAPPRP